VKTVKRALSVAISDSVNKHVSKFTLLNRFLLNYRNTPHGTTVEASDLLMTERLLCYRLDIIHLSVNEKVEEKQLKQIENYNCKIMREFEVGDM